MYGIAKIIYGHNCSLAGANETVTGGGGVTAASTQDQPEADNGSGNFCMCSSFLQYCVMHRQ